jgi:hypothetical protein
MLVDPVSCLPQYVKRLGQKHGDTARQLGAATAEQFRCGKFCTGQVLHMPPLLEASLAGFGQHPSDGRARHSAPNTYTTAVIRPGFTKRTG